METNSKISKESIVYDRSPQSETKRISVTLNLSIAEKLQYLADIAKVSLSKAVSRAVDFEFFITKLIEDGSEIYVLGKDKELKKLVLK